jgi:DNA polymerase-3 subunit epsilon
MVRRDAMQHVVNLGGHCPTTVTKDTNFLVVGDQDFRKFTDGISSSKMKKAQDLRAAGTDIELISEDDFLRMLEPVIFAV